MDEVFCEVGSHYVPESDAVEADERIGPDRIPYTTYICFTCAAEIEKRFEDED